MNSRNGRGILALRSCGFAVRERIAGTEKAQMPTAHAPAKAQPLPYMVLVVEDDPVIARNVALMLEEEGLTPDIARDGHAALRRLEESEYDLVVLDIGLPRMDGLALLQRLRNDLKLSTPVLVLTARADIEDKRSGFAHGADDYLTKPFAMEELLMRARALIRRSRQLADTAFSLEYGPLRYVPAEQAVTIDGVPVKLTRKSLLILEMLMRYSGRVVPRQKLEEYLWQGEPPSADALRGQVHLLRKTLHAHGFDGIETVHGTGWQLVGAREP